MNYATWKLNFTDPQYGTGPEEEIASQNLSCEAAWIDGQAEDGGITLGYTSEEVDEVELAIWEVKNISESEALAFCQAIDPTAYLLADGRIASEETEG